MSEDTKTVEQEKTEAPKTGGAKRLWTLLVGLGLMVMLAGAVVYLVGMGGTGSGPSGQSAGQPSGEGSGAADPNVKHPALGDADAPVVMIEYSDF